MNTHLSPKDLASAIGVSESSLKRWVDEGRLVASRTAGGHRRIALPDAVRFIRSSGSALVRPELLGVPDLSLSATEAVADGRTEVELLMALRLGHAEIARGLIIASFLASRSLAETCDGLIGHALRRIREGAHRSDHGSDIEPRSALLCMEALNQIRLMIRPPAEAADVAVIEAAAVPETGGDGVPAWVAAACLAELGVRPIWIAPRDGATDDSVAAEARHHNAGYVWVQRFRTSNPARLTQLVESLRSVTAPHSPAHVRVLVGEGGDSATAGARNIYQIGSAAEIGALVRSLRAEATEVMGTHNGTVRGSNAGRGRLMSVTGR